MSQELNVTAGGQHICTGETHISRTGADALSVESDAAGAGGGKHDALVGILTVHTNAEVGGA